MRRIIFLAFFLPFLVAGCTVPTVQTDVSRFDELPVTGPYGRFYIFAIDEQKTSLEFATYARVISLRLETWGYTETKDFDSADYVVVFDYSVGDGRTVVSSSPIVGQTGGGTVYHSGTVSTYGGTATYGGTSYQPPTFGVVGTRVRSSTMYDRYFVMRMYDLNRSTKDNLVSVYEATAASSGTNGTFAQVSRCIIDALFDDFHKAGASKVAMNSGDGKCNIEMEPDFRVVKQWRSENAPRNPTSAGGVLLGRYAGTYKWETGKRYQGVDIYFNEREGVRGDVEIYRGKALWRTPYAITSVQIKAEFNRVTHEVTIWESDPDILVSNVQNLTFTIDGSYDGRASRDLATIEATWSDPPKKGKGFLRLQRQP